MTKSEQVIKLKNRHQARLLDRLHEISTPDIVIESIKKEMYFLADDIIKQVLKPDEQGEQNAYQKDYKENYNN
jgi:hypothetical protein